MAKSYRLQFKDVNESYSISTTESPIKGLMIVRAPKGTTKAQYFEYGNAAAIEAMIGMPNADWTDLYEAETFNNSYGLYLIAPPGSTKKYPSYIGGSYYTLHGPYEFFEETDAANPSFIVPVPAGSESEMTYNIGSSTIEVSELGSPTQTTANILVGSTGDISSSEYVQVKKEYPNEGDESKYVIIVKRVNDGVFGKSEVIDTSTTTLPKQIPFTFSEPSKNVKITVTPEDGFSPSKYFLTVNENRYNPGDVDYVTFEKENNAINIIVGKDDSGNFILDDIIVYDEDGALIPEESALNVINEQIISLGASVKDETFMYVTQKGATEKVTEVTLESVGTDLYVYNRKMKAIAVFSDNEDEIAQVFENAKDSLNKSESYLAVIESKNVDTQDIEFKVHSIYSYVSVKDEKGKEISGKWVISTSDFLTQKILINGVVDNGTDPEGSGEEPAGEDEIFLHDFIFNAIVDVVEEGIFIEADDTDHPFTKNIEYNSITISSTEEVHPGKYTNGGTYTGSLSETGVNKYGDNIYWPNVLPVEDSNTSFINVYPVNSFDDLYKKFPESWVNGIFVGDHYPKNVTQDLKGTRAVSMAVEANVNNGVLGSSFTTDIDPVLGVSPASVFTAAIRDGIEEAQSEKYDDALVMMECSGREDFKPLLADLRNIYHDTSTIISPKIITAAQLAKPSTVPVNGRARGTAQYIGEFKCYDVYTGKNYYRQPIGEVGRMLARIMDLEMGGGCPAGTNDTNGCGGTLSINVLDQKWDINDGAQEIFDAKGLNAITFDAENGLMIRSQKSTEDPTDGSDWLYLGHSMSFDLCKREIRDKVMMPQLFKRINDYWLTIREQQTQAILDERTTGSDPIWDWAVAKVRSTDVNNENTKAKREFHIRVEVKVNTYSEVVILTFVTKSQE